MTIHRGDLVSPDVSIGYYGTAVVRSYTIASVRAAAEAGIRPVQIRELARGLGAAAARSGAISTEDYAKRAFEYVRQNLKTVFVFGQQKGSLGALLDQAGTSFDQSSLLVDLLKEGGITASYQLGTISLSNTAPDPNTGQPQNQFYTWAGITNATAACRLLADGGIPAKVNGGTSVDCSGVGTTVDTLLMRHMWVSAAVTRADGTAVTLSLDPTYKTNTWSSGIDIPAAMACGTASNTACGTALRGLLPTQTTIGGAPAYQNLSPATLENSMKALSMTLLNNLRGRSPALELVDAVGGARLNASALPVAGNALPYTATQVTTLAEIPDQYRVRFRVQFASIDQEMFSDELAGKRLRVLGDVGPDNSNHSGTALNVNLYAEYEIVASNNSSVVSAGPSPLTMTVNHPYAALNGTYLDTTTRMDTNTVENDDLSFISDVIRFRFNPFTIVNAWGPTGRGTAGHFGDLQQKNLYRLDVTDKTNPAHTWSRCQPYPSGSPVEISVDEGAPYRWACLRLEQPSIGANFLAQDETMIDLVARKNSSEISTHHIIGTVTSGVYWPASMSLDTALSISSRKNSSGDRQAASFTVGAMSARLEGSMSEQSGGTALGMSGPSILDMAATRGIPLINATQGNFNALRPSLTGYPAEALNRIRDTYLANGYTVVLPKEWKLGFYPAEPGSQSGITFNFGSYFVYKSAGERSGYIVADDNKGNSPVAKIDPANEVLAGMAAADASLKSRKYHSVDLQNGSLTIEPPPDLVTGIGGFPYSLSFQRSYSSVDTGLPPNLLQRDTRAGQWVHAWAAGAELRYGWRHNLDVRAAVSNNYDRAMGSQNATDAAIALATVSMLRDLQTNSSNFATEVAATYVANWWGKTIPNNSFNVSIGARTESYLRLADGTYSGESGSGAKLTTTANDYYGWYLYPSHHFHYTWDLTNPDGSVINFIQDGSFDGPYGPNGHSPLYSSGRGFYPTKWTFPSGVVVDFDYDKDGAVEPHMQYCLKEVRNNLGRKIDFHFTTDIRQPDGYCVVDNVTDENGRTVSFTDSVTDGRESRNPPDHTYTVTLPDGNSVAYHYRSTTDEPGTSRAVDVIDSWAFGTDSLTPFAQVSYDELFRVSAVSLAPNNDAGTRAVTNYSIGGLSVGEGLRRGEVRDATGAVSTHYFGKFGQILQSISPLGFTTTNLYDSRHRLRKTIYPEGNSTDYEYDARNNQTKVTDSPKAGSTLPAAVQTSQYSEAATVALCTNFATCNKLTASTDPKGNVSTFAYDPDGQLREVLGASVDGEQARTNYCYTSMNGIRMLTGRIDLVGTNPARPDRVKTFSYNPANRYVLDRVTIDPVNSLAPDCTPVSKPLALDRVMTLTFDGIGNARTLDGARTDVADQSIYDYDAMRRLKQIDLRRGDDPAYATTKYEYYTDGTLKSTSRKDETAWRTEVRTYWPSGDLRTITNPDGHTVRNLYDGTGKPTLTIDPEGRGTGTVYDPEGRQACVWRGITSGEAPQNCDWNSTGYAGVGPVRDAAFSYTANGKRSRVQDANNNITDYHYDNHDRLRFVLYPNAADGTRCSLTLTTAGSRDTAVPSCAASGGKTPTYEQLLYSTNGTPTGARCGGEDQICRKLMRNGQTVVYTYDALNRVASRKVGSEPTVTYKYNLLSEPRSVTSPAGTIAGRSVPAHSTTYEFDDAGNQSFEENLSNGSSRRVSFSYDAAGNRAKVTWPDGYFIKYDYDALNRLEYVRENSDTGGELARLVFDQVSRRTELRFAGQGTNKLNYAYEPDGNLDLLTDTRGVSGNVTLDYDRNRSGQIRGMQTNDPSLVTLPAPLGLDSYTPNRLNQYDVAAGETANYDANGNLLNLGTGAGQRLYTYDLENRLRTARIGTGATTIYDYDGLGRRISKNVGGTSTFFLLAGDDEIGEYSAAGTVLRRYIPGSSIDERIAVAEGSTVANPPKSYYHVDHKQSVLATSDETGRTSGCAAGANCQKLSYDEFGNLLSGVTTGQPYRYAGRRFDEESGLYYYRARYYAPRIGSFLQVDPIGYEDDFNMYSYVKGDPVNLVDPSGKNCDNVPRENLSATTLNCWDKSKANGPTPATDKDAIMTPQWDRYVTSGNRGKNGQPDSGVMGTWDPDHYEHGSMVLETTAGVPIWARVLGHTCDDPSDSKVVPTLYKADFQVLGPAFFVHEHGLDSNYPYRGDNAIPDKLGIPNVMIGENGIAVVEISGGEFRVRLIEGFFTQSEIGEIKKILTEWSKKNGGYKPPDPKAPASQQLQNCTPWQQ